MNTNLLIKLTTLRRKVKGMREFVINEMTRVFAENDDGSRFILTNNQVATFDDLSVHDKGCLVDTNREFKSPELPIMVLTKQEYFGKVKTKIDIEKVKKYRTVG